MCVFGLISLNNGISTFLGLFKAKATLVESCSGSI